MATAVRTPDAELLRRLRTRDRDAWVELYAEYQPRLRAFAYRLAGNVHDADDLVQETFVRAVPRLDRLDPDTTDIGAYLFTTLRNLFLEQVARQKRQQPVAEVPEPTLPTHIEDDPERSALFLRQQREVRVANARLQPRQRLVLALRELEDRSYAEIGELVGMKENAVAQLIFRARESLRLELRLAQVDPDALPEECRRFLPLLAAHLDGQLKGARRDETLAHLESCERCQAALADMAEASRRYRTLLLPPIGADDARAAVDERLEEVGYWRAPRRRLLGRRTLQVGLAAAAVIVLAGAGTAVGVSLTSSAEEAVAPPITTSTSTRAVTGTPIVEPVTTSTGSTTTSTQKQTTTALTKTKPKPKPKPKAAPKTTTTVPKTTTTTTVPAVTTHAKPKPKPKPKPKAPVIPPKPKPDTTAPTVTITNGPGGGTSTDVADVAFTASESGVTFACRLDGGAYAPCSSPVHLTGLAGGGHTFSVRATDKAGNVGPAASVAWTYTPPDTTPPTVTIASGPPASTTDTSASFTFSSNEQGGSFSCSLDGAAYVACASPAAYSSLATGAHAFSVRATDPAGNTGEAATHNWTVVPLLPDLYVSKFSKNSITISNRGNTAAGRSVLTITNVGTFTVPALPPGGSATFSWSTCKTAVYSAVVDRTQVVAESDESNNTATLKNTCSSVPGT